MQFKFLGTGGVFDVQYGNSSATVDLEHRILIDCGPSVFPKLLQTNIIDTIDFVLLTHLHGDHVGSLFQMIFFFRNRLKRSLCFLVGNPDFASEIRALLRCQGVPDDYYSFKELANYDGIDAYDTSGLHVEGVTSFAYVFKQGGHAIYYSGDLGCIQTTKNILERYKNFTVTVFHEMHHLRSTAHVHYTDLNPLCKTYEVHGYHCNPTLIPPDSEVPLVWENANLLW